MSITDTWLLLDGKFLFLCERWGLLLGVSGRWDEDLLPPLYFRPPPLLISLPLKDSKKNFWEWNFPKCDRGGGWNWIGEGVLGFRGRRFRYDRGGGLSLLNVQRTENPILGYFSTDVKKYSDQMAHTASDVKKYSDMKSHLFFLHRFSL